MLAYGGVFSTNGGVEHSPTDLTMTRVVFEVDPGLITAHVWLSFDGNANEMAWVLPVDEIPEVEESSVEFFRALESNSGLEVQMPASEPCLAPETVTPTIQESGGCSCGGGSVELPSDPEKLEGPESEHPPVLTFGTTFTDSWQVETVGASTSENLINWLQQQGFAVSENMRPAMEAYDQFEKKFVVIRLRNGVSANDAQPLKLTYPGDRPEVPLQMTGVAARPGYGLLVMILGGTTFMPENFVAVPPRANEILFDGEHNISYFEWVARAAAESDGHLFVSEYIGLNPLQNSRHTFLSRFFTRISPRHMDSDPVFRSHPDPTYRAGPTIDLVQQQSLYLCNELVDERIPSACAFNFCGMTGECAVVGEQVGCVCAPGEIAEHVIAPDGTEHVVCAAREDPYGIDLTDFGLADACDGVTCGSGDCVVKHGRPVCDCLPGMVAALDGKGSVTCLSNPSEVDTFGPGAGVESRPMVTASYETTSRGIYAGALWMLFALALGWRRR